jgi:hypothetical protein
VPLDRASAEGLRVGDVVSFSSKPSGGSGEAAARHRLVVNKQELGLDAQAAYPGPVALDRISRDSLAPYGFGAEVRRALDRRDAELRRLGIDPGDEARGPKLRELERRAIAERVAARLGQSVVTDGGGAFRGRVEVSERGAAGTRYAVLSDGARVLVVPATRELIERNGKLAVASMDRHGTWHVRSPDQDRDR